MTQEPEEQQPAESVLARLSRSLGPDVDPRVDLDEGESARDASESTRGGSGTSALVGRLRDRPAVSSRYRVEGEIARGGMGAILEVWDEDLRRRLAMKVALSGGEGTRAADDLDPRLLSRFLEEAQVTGQLEHPGIVPVHELGIDENGVVFFTMQRVRGRDLEQVLALVADEVEGWSVTRVLGVLLKVCEAMAFAHSKGVIHRDLKPANVMVGSFGEVYVMDWGLVRIRGRDDRHDVRIREGGIDVDERTDTRGGESEALHTMDGEVLGTPAYMSPEQARGDVEQLDERADVYALGAMLYRLLAGVAPYDRPGSRRRNAAEILTALYEGPPPALTTLAPDAPAELVAIAEKAMAREASGRYADMQGLAEDLRAFLENRVVQAYRTGAVVEARKWVRRNRPLAASLAAGLVVLVGGLFASLVLKAQSDANAERAGRQASIAREVADFLNDDLFAAIAPEHDGLDVTVREVLAAASNRLEGRFENEPLVEAELRRTIGTSFERLGEYAIAGGHLERAHELFAAEEGERSEPALSTAILVGGTWIDRGQFNESLEHFADLVEVCEEEFGPHDVTTLEARSAIALIHGKRGDLDVAAQLYAELEGDLRRELGDRHELTLVTLGAYATFLTTLGRYEEAEALQTETLEGWRATVGEASEFTFQAADALGEVYVDQGRYAEAEKLLLDTQATRERVLGPDHPTTANGLSQLGFHYFIQGRHEEAHEYYSKSYELMRRSLGSEHPQTLQIASNLAGALNRLDRRDESLELREATLEAQRRTLGEEHPQTLTSMSNLAVLLQDMERYDEAEAASLEAIDLYDRVFGFDHPDTLIVRENLSRLWNWQGRYAESVDLTLEVLEGRRRAFGPEHPAVARTMFNLGYGYRLLEDRVTARKWFEEALDVAEGADAVDVSTNARAELAGMAWDDGDAEGAIAGFTQAAARRREFGIEDAVVADWLYEAGRCAWTLQDFEGAANSFGEAVALRRDVLGNEHVLTMRARVSQARMLQGAGRFEEAEELSLQIYELYAMSEGEESENAGKARALIVSLYEAWGRPEEAGLWRD